LLVVRLLAGDVAAVEQQFAVGWVDGLLTTTTSVDRERLCPARSRTAAADCVVQLDVSVTPVQFFRVIRALVHVDDVNDNAPTFPVRAVNVSVYELATPGPPARRVPRFKTSKVFLTFFIGKRFSKCLYQNSILHRSKCRISR